ncbi:MAG TPA: WD40 repeat domain-containing serine/threonine-protein kinase [Candidatus Brocadiia bacterium]|nr:WD40 repeat domain-containing serine/threonine-protein kinase [Candidatus Brocadiia bacterium]
MGCDVTREELVEFLGGGTAGARRQWLESHIGRCADCQRLLSELNTIIVSGTAEDSSSILIEETRAGSVKREEIQSPLVGKYIGKYKILETVGRGGMGTVYKAEQQRPRRTVALKVMRLAVLASDSDRRRFEREAEAMAKFQHPGIVPIYEYGEAEGVPFFSMEYVEGQRLDSYCESKGLDLRARLKLMARVCEAVAYAHQRGVIHRDLKPGNILVDSVGQPKILDFGLAKALHEISHFELPTEITADGEIMGTVAYMAPEQSKGRSGGADTRSDVYSLGVVLFNLLTGDFPYDLSGGPLTIMDRIQHTDPKRPRSINKAIDKEVEAIVLKALEKDSQRRYGTAESFGNDIRRYLNGEPIEAKGASGIYLFSKSVRRNWKLMAVASFCLIVLISALSYVLVRTRAERSRAREAAEKERSARIEAEKSHYDSAIARADQLSLAGDYQSARDVLRQAPSKLRDWEWHHLNYRCMTRGWKLSATFAHAERVDSVSFSPDGKLLASGCADGIVRLWDVEEGREIGRPEWSVPELQGVRLDCAARFSRTGGTMIMAKGNVIELRRLPDFTPLRRWLVKGLMPQTAVLSDDGSMLAAQLPYGLGVLALGLQAWDTATGADILQLIGRRLQDTVPPRFSGDGRYLAFLGESELALLNELTIVGVSARQPISQWKLRISDFCFKRGESVIIAAEDTGRVHILPLSKDARQWSFDAPVGTKIVRTIAHPNGRMVALARASGQIDVVDTTTGKPLTRLREHNGSYPTDMCFSPDGKRFASCSDDQTVRVYSTDESSEILSLPSSYDIFFAPDGGCLISQIVDRQMRFADSRGTAYAEIPGAEGAQAGEMEDPRSWVSWAVSPRWDAIVYLTAFGSLRCRDMRTGARLWATPGLWRGTARPKELEDQVKLKYSADGATVILLAVGRLPQKMVVIRGGTGEVIQHFSWKGEESAKAFSMDISPDGRMVAVGLSGPAQRDFVNVIDLRRRTSAKILQGVPAPVVRFGPQPGQLAVGSSDGTLSLVSLEAGIKVLTWDAHVAHTRGGVAPSFHPSGTRLASYAVDGTRIWDVASRREVLSLPGYALEFGPGGNILYGRSTTGKMVFVTSAKAEEAVEAAEANLWRPADPRSVVSGTAFWLTSIQSLLPAPFGALGSSSRALREFTSSMDVGSLVLAMVRTGSFDATKGMGSRLLAMAAEQTALGKGAAEPIRKAVEDVPAETLQSWFASDEALKSEEKWNTLAGLFRARSYGEALAFASLCAVFDRSTENLAWLALSRYFDGDAQGALLAADAVRRHENAAPGDPNSYSSWVLPWAFAAAGRFTDAVNPWALPQGGVKDGDQLAMAAVPLLVSTADNGPTATTTTIEFALAFMNPDSDMRARNMLDLVGETPGKEWPAPLTACLVGRIAAGKPGAPNVSEAQLLEMASKPEGEARGDRMAQSYLLLALIELQARNATKAIDLAARAVAEAPSSALALAYQKRVAELAGKPAAPKPG